MTEVGYPVWADIARCMAMVSAVTSIPVPLGAIVGSDVGNAVTVAEGDSVGGRVTGDDVGGVDGSSVIGDDVGDVDGTLVAGDIVGEPDGTLVVGTPVVGVGVGEDVTGVYSRVRALDA